MGNEVMTLVRIVDYVLITMFVIAGIGAASTGGVYLPVFYGLIAGYILKGDI